MRDVLNECDNDFLSCDECSFSLFLYPNDASPYDIISLFKIVPTYIAISGEKCVGMAGKSLARQGFIPRKSIVAVISDQFIFSKDIRDHIDYVFNEINKDITGLMSVLPDGDVGRRIYLSWWSNTGRGGPIIRSDQLKFIANIGIGLDITFSFYNHDIETDRDPLKEYEYIKYCRADVLGYFGHNKAYDISHEMSSLLIENKLQCPNGDVCNPETASILFSSHGAISTNDVPTLFKFISDHKEEILNRVRNISSCEKERTVIRITIYMIYPDSGTGFVIDINDIMAISDIGIDLEFDIRWL